MMALTSTALQTQRRELVEEAMKALSCENPRARRWSIALAARYRRMIGPKGVYNRAAKFSELRQALKKEAEGAKELARRIAVITGRTQTALNYLYRPILPGHLIDQQAIDDIIWRRYEIARDLDLYADQIDQLVKRDSWPKGGDLDLAKTYLGPPKRWLVGECLTCFFHHADIRGIRPLSSAHGSPFGDYVCAIYELGTGEDPLGSSVGLTKIIDHIARQWRRNEKRSNPDLTITRPILAPGYGDD
jgi:hypothetical protein